ncbi:hypothetical protein C1646_799086 [Rhizophagus diaphanus]|nr:hypothetical protein C1646_799086 [Rhizophagus diaphanus] [Rhizophagus sp. MUCL 43196]
MTRKKKLALKKNSIFRSSNGNFLKSWSDIKRSLKNKYGRQPAWYQFLIDNIVRCPGNLCLNLSIYEEIIQNPSIKRSRIPQVSTTPHDYKRKNIWIAYWSPTSNDVVYGKILTVTNYSYTLTYGYAEHFVIDSSTILPPDTTAKSRDYYIRPCQGCSLHTTFYMGGDQGR